MKCIHYGAILFLVLFIVLVSNHTFKRSPDDLYVAINSRRLDTILEEIVRGGSVDEMYDGHSKVNPIMYVWRNNPDKKIIKMLLENGADVNYTDSEGKSLLMYASGAEAQNYFFRAANQSFDTNDLCKMFLDYGADVHLVDNTGMQAIDYAAWGGDEETITLLLEHGAIPDSKTLSHALEDSSSYCNYRKIKLLVTDILSRNETTSLAKDFEAAVSGNSSAILSNYDIERRSLQVIFYSAAFCSDEALRFVTTNIRDLSTMKDANGNTLLDVAATFGNMACMNYLLQSAEWSPKEMRSALHCALEGDHYDAVKVLLKSGAEVKSTRANWVVFDNLMDLPATNGNIALIQLLIEYGYPLDEITAWYAMKNAAKFGNINVIQYFSSLGYDIDFNANNTQSDKSVLYDACSFEQLLTVKYLVEHGANTDAEQKCLTIATERGNYELCKYLLENGAVANATTTYADGSHSQSAIEIAESKGYLDILSMLITGE